MARKLTASEAEGIEFGSAGAKYPWDEWLDGGMWVLERGEDFTSAIDTLKDLAAKAGRNRDLKVRTTRLGTTTLVIQAYKES